IQCPVDFVAPLVLGAQGEARRLLLQLRSWGIDRFSLSWQHPHARKVLARLESWGHDVNLRGIDDLESFLHAIVLLPRSIDVDFDSAASAGADGAQPILAASSVMNFGRGIGTTERI